MKAPVDAAVLGNLRKIDADAPAGNYTWNLYSSELTIQDLR
ncbi:hypothetical protein CKA32_001919 [Geitlerinema sp. FC II]|nr:hypothetical protein [Baaleninema simplex]MDC0833575.1 hypothetical protein [Geitlerinema sp. CS-897]PPT07709.1 hypothetical protein CKA32_001919 [Geitlerinema sp. FC II]